MVFGSFMVVGLAYFVCFISPWGLRKHLIIVEGENAPENKPWHLDLIKKFFPLSLNNSHSILVSRFMCINTNHITCCHLKVISKQFICKYCNFITNRLLINKYQLKIGSVCNTYLTFWGTFSKTSCFRLQPKTDWQDVFENIPQNMMTNGSVTHQYILVVFQSVKYGKDLDEENWFLWGDWWLSNWITLSTTAWARTCGALPL